MTATQSDLAGLSRFIFRTPRWYASTTFALVVAAVTGVAVFDSAFVLDDAWQGLFFVGLPTVAASVLTTTIDRWLGGQLTPDRASLLALTSELVVVAVLLGAGGVSVLTGFGQRFVFDALLVALAAIFGLRLLVIKIISRQRTPIAAIPASIQTVAAAVMLFVYSGTVNYFNIGGRFTHDVLARTDHAPPELAGNVVPLDFVLLGTICVVHGVAVWAFLTVIDIPWRRSLGVSVFDFIQGFIGHLTDGTDELEEFFEDIGEEARVPVTVLSFRRPNGREKARFVLPMLHPGPMGDIGGGSLPMRLAAQAEGLGFAPHATAGHDFNLVTEREVDTVCDAAERAYQRIEYGRNATPSVQVREGDATLTGQAFGDDALAVASFAPCCTDDVMYSVGLSAATATRTGGLDDVLLIDAHNCNDGLAGDDLGHVVPGSPRSYDLIEGAERLGDRLRTLQRGELALGVASDPTPWDPEDGIGPLGIRVAVTDVDGQRTGYVLIDGNNMQPGLRDRIDATVEGVDHLEVMTSDTHVVNTVEAENQVGMNLPAADLIELVADLVERAADDCEPVEAGMASEPADVTVFGNDRTETLASHANAAVSMGSALAVVVMLAVISMSILIFLFASAIT